MDVKGRKVLVAGTGKSGIAASKLLLKAGAYVVLYDGNEKLDIEKVKENFKDLDRIEIVLGKIPARVYREAALLVISPGIDLDQEFVHKAEEQKIPVWGELELAYVFSKGEVVAITGTNGKTTTTALVGKIMEEFYDSVFVVGNIGIPYTEIALSTKDDSVTVAEVSSFQLETIHEFAPKVSAILNITPDHLNRHKTFENYIKIKESITKNQNENDLCVLNYDDPETRKFGESCKVPVTYFSRLHELEKGVFLKDNTICYRDKECVKICRVDEMKLLGGHNIENVMAAVGIAMGMKVPVLAVRRAVIAFKAVEHRIEYVATKKGVEYYNDSKGTNPDAAIKGIQAMIRPTVLIAGGYDKNSEYEDWIRSFDGKVKYLVLLGATKEKIAAAAKKCGFTDIIMVETLEEAVKVSEEKTVPGDAVLLSPACASWGMFRNYEERGKLFKDYVNSLEE